MAKTIIPAGYRLSVVSWENDGDNYRTEVLEGLTAEQVKFYVAVCKLFYSENGYSRNDKTCFGNMYEPSEAELQEAYAAVKQVAESFRGLVATEELDNAIEDPLDFIAKFISYSPDYTTRVFESCKVEYTPCAIILQDVTADFLKE